MQRVSRLLLVPVMLGLACRPSPAAYDPLAVADDATCTTVDLKVHDAARHRDLPLRVYLPSSTEPAPVALFSHGLGGNCRNNRYLGEHWARRGYVGVFLQHPGSDDSVWRDAAPAARMKAMNEAANARNFLLRVKDVPAVLEQLAVWNQATDHALHGRLDLDHVGLSGHSFGAVTTQAVSGQSLPVVGQRYTDPRVDAAICFSPSGARQGANDAAFGQVAIPWLLMTGTKDTSPIGNQDVASRLAVYPALPPGDKYEVVLFGAQHSAFSDHPLPGENLQRNPNHHRVILALATAFWDAYLRGRDEAKAWLQGDGPRAVMEPQDRWQRK